MNPSARSGVVLAAGLRRNFRRDALSMAVDVKDSMLKPRPKSCELLPSNMPKRGTDVAMQRPGSSLITASHA
eukprot:CAMPEP_0195113474 /NCGR_PEP_ID=MMETSP0448-20130528/102639_1 /TAXON_ID=66468 /ORGANISM="Heterocapsa triquestra, Strain CCMP 448" /LENGTH=71 /DNA_ID=CAMNT_0040150417 /DNA_START=27 /DNA_END=238 /DNA_ORIENTATION=+